MEKLIGQVDALRENHAVLTHRVTSIEQMTQRVMHLERDMVGVKREVCLAREEIQDVKIATSDTINMLKKLQSRINQLFWTGAGVVLTTTFIGAAAALAINLVNSGMLEQ